MSQLNDIVEAKGGVWTLPFGADGKTINLGRLSVGDQADAGAFLIKRRYEHSENGTGTMPITIETRAKMLADIACAPVYLSDVMDDLACRIKLIELGAKRAGNPVPYAALKDGLTAMPPGLMQQTILWLLNLEAKKDDQNP